MVFFDTVQAVERDDRVNFHLVLIALSNVGMVRLLI
ncbi:MAG: hypothetical protein ACI85E_001097 [Marinomonas primoryensis]|jgi:hypothetical protein